MDPVERCSRCKRKLTNDNDRVLVDHCGCLFCPMCVLIGYDNGVYQCLKCKPSASDLENIEYRLHYSCGVNPPSILNGTSGEMEAVSNSTVNVVRYSKDRFPLFYMKSIPKPERSTKKLLALYQADDKGKIRRISVPLSVVRQKGEKCVDLDEAAESRLVGIFALLHPVIFGSAFTETKSKPQSASERLAFIMSPGELFDFSLEDQRLPTKCIRALGTGFQEPVVASLGNNEYVSRLMGAFVASEMLVRINHMKPQRLQLAVDELLDTNGASVQLKQILCKMRLCSSPDTSKAAVYKKLFDELERGCKPAHLEMVQVGFDNIGFRSKAGYSQHCAVVLYIITYEALKQAGFYCDNPDTRLCRIRKVMDDVFAMFEDDQDNEELQQRKVAEQIVGCKDTDLNELSKYCLNITKYSIDIAEFCPSFEMCTNMIKQNDYSYEHEFKKNLGCDIDSFYKPLTDKEKELGRTPTLYERNNMVVDVPIHDNPNGRECVVNLANYGQGIAAGILANVNNDPNGSNESHGERPVQEIVTPFVTDGSPILEFLREQSERAAEAEELGQDQDLYEVARKAFYPGGFHCNLELLRMIGKGFRDLFAMFLKTHRKTVGTMNWIVNPSDPRDTEAVTIETYLAIECAAVDTFKEEFPLLACTAANVSDHKIQCAKDNPLAMGVLILGRYHVVHFMMRDSEKMGPAGAELFISALRLALPLFTTTHAPHYTRITCEFLEWYELASEADKTLFKHFFFTKISPHGKAIWVDRAMEWVIGHLRCFLGKHAAKDQQMRLHRACVMLPERIARKRSQNVFTGPGISRASPLWNDQEMKYSKVFVNTYGKCRELGIWSRQNEDNGQEVQAARQVAIPGVGVLSASILSTFSIGTERSINYYKTFYVQSRNQTSRSEEDVSLKLLSCTAEARQGNLATELVIKTSTSTIELVSQKQLTVSMIKSELVYLRGMYDEIPSDSDLKQLDRPRLILLLSQWRAHYYQDFPDMLEFHRDVVISQFEAGAESTKEQREEELAHAFFSLTQEVKDDPCFN